MRHIISTLLMLASVVSAVAQTPIKGEETLTGAQIAEYILERNPDFDPAIADEYIRIGRRYGIRGDVALCQAILETGWFRYEGSAVCPEDHNYCGLGVVGGGVKGAGFATLEEGVKAHIQHLFAYCSTRPLPQREAQVDPRFTYVTRGVAPNWEDLNGRWAMNPEYSKRILSIYDKILKRYAPQPAEAEPIQ